MKEIKYTEIKEGTFKKVIIDIEANDFFESSINFSKGMPFKFKEEARIWCIVIRDVDTFNYVVLDYDLLKKEILKQCLRYTDTIIGHYVIGYDFPALRLFNLLDYTIGYPYKKSYFFNKEIQVIDTLALSKFLAPDRFGGHSLDDWGKRHGIEKFHFDDFSQYTEEMRTYCIQDTLNNLQTYTCLLKEIEERKYQDAYFIPFQMEMKLMDITVKQSVYGFEFNTELAEFCVEDLNTKMEEIRKTVNPLLPPKLLNKGEQKHYTPPKSQILKNGDLSASIIKFVAKIESKIEGNTFVFEGKEFTIPYYDPIKETIEADVDDLDHLKGFLLSLGWDPIEWKERDLTRDSKKIKLTPEKFEATVKRYVDSTINGPYKEYRLKILDNIFEDNLEEYLFDKYASGQFRVPISPCIRTGTDKVFCPNLELLGQKASFARDVTIYFTYRHRKNSISGSNSDEDGSPSTGYLSLVREDGRISTPADTLGAASFRYLHKSVI